MASLLLQRFDVTHVFLVSEGQTDYEVLKAVVEQLGEDRGADCSITPLFPSDQADENHGGWTNLRAWCKRQADTLVAHNGKLVAARLLNGVVLPHAPAPRPTGDRLTAALKLHGNDNSKIVVQLDTDVVEEFADATLLGQCSHPLSASDRYRLGKAALDSWLGGHAEKVGTSIIYCLATHATETFILATHSQDEVSRAIGCEGVPINYDDVPRPERVLIEFGYGSQNSSTGRKLKKQVFRYRQYSKRVAANLALARQNSKILNNFCQAIVESHPE